MNARTEALSRYPVRDTPPDVALDDLTALAAHVCEAPMALLVFVDEHRLWFKSRLGFATPDDAPDSAFCWQAVRQRDLFVVPDATRDERFAQDACVVGEPRARFFAGAPLVSPEGQILGVLGVMDRVPRQLLAAQEQALRTLGRQVMTQLELVRRTRELALEREDRHRQLAMLRQTQFTLDHTSDSVHWVRADGRLLYANEPMCRALGYAKEELLALSLFDIDPNVTRELWPDHWRKMRGLEHAVIQSEHRTRAGGKFPVEVAITFIRYGEEEFFCAYARDITQRRRTEEAIRELSRRNEESLFVARMGHWEFEVETGCFTFNDQYYLLHGMTAREAGGYRIPPEEFARKYVHADDAALVQKSIDQALAAPDPDYQNQVEARILRVDGEVRYVAVWFRVERGAQGVVKLRGVSQDITDRRRTEVALRETEFFLNKSQQVAQIGSYKFEVATGTWIGSSSLDAIFGIDERFPRNVDGWLNLVVPEQREEMRRHLLDQVMVGRHRFKREYRIVRQADGQERWVCGLGELEYDSQGKPRRMIGTIQDITDRKQAEAALHESNEILRALIQASPVPIILFDPQWLVKLWNPAAERVFGWRETEVLGQSLPFIAEENQEEHRRLRERVDRGESVADVEVKRHRKDGSPVDLSISTAALRDATGKVTGIMSVNIDITERKRAESALRMFQFSTDEAADAVFWMDRHAGFYYVNDQACRSLGYTREELTHLRLFDIDSDYPRESWESDWRQFQEGRIQTQQLETWHRRKDGTRFPVEISARQFRFDDTDLHVAFARDITQRKRVEEHLRQSQAELDATYTHAPIILCLLDAQLQVHRLNRAGLEFASLAGTDPVGMPFCRLLGCPEAGEKSTSPRSASACATCVLCRTLTGTLTQGRSHYRVEVTRGLLRGGITRELTLLASTVAIPMEKEALVLLCLEDITDHRQAEKAQARLETQLRQAQKMEAIGTLAGGIAHDFNNILGAIIGNADLARMDTAADHPSQESLSEISLAARRAGDLVRQILAFSRQQKPRREIVRLQPIIKEALKLLRAAIPSTVAIQSELDEAGPTVLADPTQVHQVMMNLCTNAYHALPQRDGRLTVKLAVVEVDDVLTSQHAELRPGRYLRLSVSDNGRGMERAILDRIFEPFFTTKPAGQGTGLGLSVVHGIVRSHEGAITVYSEPRQGTTFHVYFPASTEEALPEATPAAIPRGHGERILFLDDEEPLVRAAKKVLDRLGYQVTALTNPADTLEVFRAESAPFDLVITDLSMPGMNGLDFARELLALRPTQAILLSTGFSGTMTPDGLREMGLRDLLWKPVTARSLGETVHKALRAKPGGST